MTKITYRPFSEIIVHEIIENKPDELFGGIMRQNLATGNAGFIPSVSWIDGVAFSIGVFPDTEEVVRDKLNGIIHYASIRYALFPEYRSEASVRVDNMTYNVRLQKIDSNETLTQLAKYLKNKDYQKA